MPQSDQRFTFISACISYESHSLYHEHFQKGLRRFMTFAVVLLRQIHQNQANEDDIFIFLMKVPLCHARCYDAMFSVSA